MPATSDAVSPRGTSTREADATNKAAVIERNRRFLNPHRVDTFERIGVSIVMGRREGYRFWDLDGRELLDLHLNGGTFNLGHRNPDLVAALVEALSTYDIGNHHFSSTARGELAEALAATSPAGELTEVVLSPSGSEAIDVAVKSARHATERRKIVAWDCAYHGRSGLSGAAGDPAAAQFFRSDTPADFVTVPFDDVDALEATLAGKDVAAVLAETIPATAGFPLPSTGFYPAVRELCDRHGTLLIVDEVQTGLGRTGHVWAIDGFGVTPDALVCGKGLSGGLYPMAATLLGERAAGWLSEDGWAYVSTFGGSEVGSVVALEALRMSTAPETLANVARLAARFGDGLTEISARHPFLTEIRQRGLVMGLRFDDPLGAVTMAGKLYEAGLWAMFSGFDTSVLQWKPGLLADDRFATAALDRLESALGQALA